MRTIQFLPFIILLSIINAQEVEPVHKGSDYFRVEPGAVWYIDGRTAEGETLSIYHRYSISEQLSPTSSQIPITKRTVSQIDNRIPQGPISSGKLSDPILLP